MVEPVELCQIHQCHEVWQMVLQRLPWRSFKGEKIQTAARSEHTAAASPNIAAEQGPYRFPVETGNP